MPFAVCRLPFAFGHRQPFKRVYETRVDSKAVTLKLGRQTSFSQIDRIFAKNVFPLLGPLPIAEISRQHLIELLRRIESRQAFTTAEKCRTWFNQLFCYAMVEKGQMTNPSADLGIVAIPNSPVTNNPYLVMEEMPLLLQKLRTYGGSTTTIKGLRLLFLTGGTGELRLAVPEQFDLVKGAWMIPAAGREEKARGSGSAIWPDGYS